MWERNFVSLVWVAAPSKGGGGWWLTYRFRKLQVLDQPLENEYKFRCTGQRGSTSRLLMVSRN